MRHGAELWTRLTEKPDRFVFKQPSEAVLLEREEALRLRRLKENEKQMNRADARQRNLQKSPVRYRANSA